MIYNVAGRITGFLARKSSVHHWRSGKRSTRRVSNYGIRVQHEQSTPFPFNLKQWRHVVDDSTPRPFAWLRSAPACETARRTGQRTFFRGLLCSSDCEHRWILKWRDVQIVNEKRRRMQEVEFVNKGEWHAGLNEESTHTFRVRSVSNPSWGGTIADRACTWATGLQAISTEIQTYSIVLRLFLTWIEKISTVKKKK